MALAILFILGVANFAICKAVLESGHPLLGSGGTMRLFGGRVGLMVEFVVLLGSMLMVASGAQGWAEAPNAWSAIATRACAASRSAPPARARAIRPCSPCRSTRC